MELNLGFGIGLRRSHYNEILKSSELPDWFEVLSENVIDYGGKTKSVLDYLFEKNIPVINHGVGLNLGGPDDFDEGYLELLEAWINNYKPLWFSDHLCFSALKVHQYHDLLPIIKNEKSLGTITDKIKKLEDRFQIPFAFENISYYGESKYSQYSELEFINSILDKTESFLLLDINNIYVNEKNLNHNAQGFIDGIDLQRVIQVHLAGHWDRGDIVIDTHGSEVNEDVFELYKYFLKKRKAPVSTLIEWDNNVPSLAAVMAQAQKAKIISNEVFK